MNSIEESLATWTTFLATVVSLFGLFQSQAWLAAVGGVFACASVLALSYARKERLVVESGRVQVGDRSFDSLNMANLRRRITRSLVVQEAHHVARIDGEDLTILWRYSGYCRDTQATAMEFSIDSDHNIPFSDLECVAYDLRHDPGKKHGIRPVLVGPDGLSKKLAVPFLEPIAAQQSFDILLKCRLPECMKAGLEYYTSTLSFSQPRLQRHTVRLIFEGARPHWVRVYECDTAGNPGLLKDLRTSRTAQGTTEYLDTSQGLAAQAVRLYVFFRSGSSHRPSRIEP